MGKPGKGAGKESLPNRKLCRLALVSASNFELTKNHPRPSDARG
jgi:hypothetical protein